MHLNSLKRAAMMVRPLASPISVSDALKAFIEAGIEVVPVKYGSDLKGLYFRDTVSLVINCRDGKACLNIIPDELLTEIPYLDISLDDAGFIEGLKKAVESETSAALMMRGLYVGIVPHKKIAAFVHEQKIQEAVMTNPLTGLPGNYSIRKEFDRKNANGDRFFACYMDLNDFKAYNDKYGIARGDDVIKFAALLLRQRCCENFVGHVGGDDFLFFLQPETAVTILEGIVSDFEKGIVDFYNEVHRSQGCIITLDRDGKTRSFPLMSTIIAAVLVESQSSFECINTSLVALKEQLKKECKNNKGGSRYALVAGEYFTAA